MKTKDAKPDREYKRIEWALREKFRQTKGTK
jgi:hypothetical protein